MKKLVLVFALVAAVTAAYAAPTAKSGRGSSRKAAAAKAAVDTDEEEGPVAKVHIEQYPKLGRQATLPAPNVGGGSTIGQAWNGRPRSWIVLETKYSTTAKCIDQLTFVWHVVLETETATSKDKEGQAKMAPFSYFNTSVTYVNIPRGTHAASVCLHPSYLEQYGEPKAVGLVVLDANGKEIAGDTMSEMTKYIPKGSKFWDDPKVMDTKQSNGIPYLERRQGLQDRSKTIWGLVNPNDYELVIQ